MELQNDTTIIEIIDSKDVIQLHPKELAMLRRLRSKYRFGEVTIIMHEGIPKRFKRVVENEEI